MQLFASPCIRTGKQWGACLLSPKHCITGKAPLVISRLGWHFKKSSSVSSQLQIHYVIFLTVPQMRCSFHPFLRTRKPYFRKHESLSTDAASAQQDLALSPTLSLLCYFIPPQIKTGFHAQYSPCKCLMNRTHTVAIFVQYFLKIKQSQNLHVYYSL